MSASLEVSEQAEAAEGMTDDQCADFILIFFKRLRSDKVFSRILLQMVERDGIRKVAEGLGI
jgi:hypothetical protein